MENRLISYFRKITDLSPEEAAAINDSMEVKQYKKGHVLLKEGQIKDDTFFVMEGLVRQYKVLNEAEITTGFFCEEDWIISFNDFGAKKPSAHYLVCMEDTSLVTGNEEKAKVLFRDQPRLETVSRMVMEKSFEENQRVMTAYITDTPEQRYRTLLDTRPDIFQRVPLYHIATYIGVTPESLSRIRKRIADQ